MNNYRVQKNISLTIKQQEYVRANHGKITYIEMQKVLKIGYNKIVFNARLMGLTSNRMKKIPPIKKDEPPRVIDFGRNGYFDIKKWSKIVSY